MCPEFMRKCTTLSAERSSHVAMTSNLRLCGTLLLVGGEGEGLAWILMSTFSKIVN